MSGRRFQPYGGFNNRGNSRRGYNAPGGRGGYDDDNDWDYPNFHPSPYPRNPGPRPVSNQELLNLVTDNQPDDYVVVSRSQLRNVVRTANATGILQPNPRITDLSDQAVGAGGAAPIPSVDSTSLPLLPSAGAALGIPQAGTGTMSLKDTFRTGFKEFVMTDDVARGAITHVATQAVTQLVTKESNILREEFKAQFKANVKQQVTEELIALTPEIIHNVRDEIKPVHTEVVDLRARLARLEQLHAAAGAGAAPQPQAPQPQAPAGGAGGMFNFQAAAANAGVAQPQAAVMPNPSARALQVARANGIPDALAGWLMNPNSNKIRTGQSLMDRINEIIASLTATNTFNGP